MLEWNELEKTCQSCNRCGLCETRHNVVFGVGPKTADVMFIGEGPGEQEDLQGEPFVGPAGKLLDDMMSIIDLDRRNSYRQYCKVSPASQSGSAGIRAGCLHRLPPESGGTNPS